MVKRVFIYENSTFHKTNKYGPAKTTWAVVTGANDGIGWSFCENLAKQRYNIVLISRNLRKLTVRSAELEKKYRVQTRIIQADFSECYSNPTFFDDTYKALDTKSIDIGILVNNVGQLILSMENQDADDVMKMAGLNTIAQFGMTKILIKDLTSRLHKSAIIDISSIAALTRRKEIPLYSASKRFNQILTMVGAEASDSSLDFLSVRPAWVSTQMTGHRNQDLFTCMPDDTVKGAFRALGRETVVFGSRKHEFLGWLLENGMMFFGYSLTRAFVYDKLLPGWCWVFGVEQVDIFGKQNMTKINK
jgi:17beta-estradiol 17-dehydrogenase / very-long-chain 3-oxoacyl-CoA reductase